MLGVRHFKYLFLCFSCMLFTGCTLKFAYNNIDWLLPLYTKTYIKFDAAQKKVLSKAIDQHKTWHRKTQLPQYLKFLDRVSTRIDTGFTTEHIQHQNQIIEGFTITLMREVIPDVSLLLQQSSEKQLNQLIKKLDRNFAEAQEEFNSSSTEDFRKQHAKKLRKHVKKWIGKLTAEQQQEFSKWEEQFIPVENELLIQQGRWLAEFKTELQAVAKPNANATAQKGLAELLLDVDRFVTQEYSAKLDHNQEITETLVVSISNSLNEKQKRKAKKALNKLKNNLLDLISG